jgi:hypothetical protein
VTWRLIGAAIAVLVVLGGAVVLAATHRGPSEQQRAKRVCASVGYDRYPADAKLSFVEAVDRLLAAHHQSTEAFNNLTTRDRVAVCTLLEPGEPTYRIAVAERSLSGQLLPSDS